MKKLIITCVLVFVFILPAVSAPSYQRELKGIIDGKEASSFYFGGFTYTHPALADLDNDGDLDLVLGNDKTILYFKNEGDSSSFDWKLSGPVLVASTGNEATPVLNDIDNDNDYDLFFGKWSSHDLTYYKNNGSSTAHSFVFVTDSYINLPLAYLQYAAFADIDGDGDHDCFTVDCVASVSFIKNTGTPDTAVWVLETTNYLPPLYEIFFCDIDGNNTLDYFSGNFDGTISLYRNDGTVNTPTWTFVTNNYESIDIPGMYPAFEFHDLDGDSDLDILSGNSRGDIIYYRNDGNTTTASFTYSETIPLSFDTGFERTMPCYVDIDNDNDYDIFIGTIAGNVVFCRNDGTCDTPDWTIVSKNYESINVGGYSAPAFVDIDNDDDFDMFIGRFDGYISFYQNVGTGSSPTWTFITNTYESIDFGSVSVPSFTDIDNDGDYDMFVGNSAGDLYFYRNAGTASLPSWTSITQNYNGIDDYFNSKPFFTDIDNDGDFDLFLGDNDSINFFRNTGTPETAAWTLVSGNFVSISGLDAFPFFNLIDINNDGFKELFTGAVNGGILYWEHSGFTVNPLLEWSAETGFDGSDGVNPDLSGYPNSFEFRVKYTQTDNEPPFQGYPKVHILKGGTEIPGSPFIMTETDPGDTAYTDGKEYSYNCINLDCSLDYTYYFECKDGWGAPATGDPIDVKDGPDVLGDISGTVTEKGQPISGVTITLSGDASGEFVTGTDGQYFFNNLSPGSTYIITPAKDNYIFIPESAAIADFLEPETVDFTGVKLFAEDLSLVKAYPNPIKPGQGVDYVTFDNLTENAKIMIYTIQGGLVLTAYPNSIDWHWYLKNDAGAKIASGVYLYVITDPADNEKKGKIAVIR